MDLDTELRNYIYQGFINTSCAPSFEQMLAHFDNPESEIVVSLHRLADDHLIVLEPDTNRVLMAHPFSNLGTSFIVTDIPDRREYYANCAWDAIVFYFMLKKAIRIDAYLRDTLETMFIEMLDTTTLTTSHPEFVVMITKPVRAWWDNIRDTRANHMHFFSSASNARNWAKERGLPAEVVTKEQLFGLSKFLYDRKLDKNYRRPTKEETQQVFKNLDLTGPFWDI